MKLLNVGSIQAGQSLLWDKGCNTHFGLKWGNYHVRNKEEIRAFFRKNTLQEYYSKFSQSIDIIQQNHQKKSAFDFDYFLSTQLLRARLIYPLTTPAVLIDLTCSRIVSPNDWDILFKDANLNEAMDCWPHRWWIGRLLNILKEFHDLMTNQLNSIEGGHLFAPVICDFFLEKGSKWNVLRLVKGITIDNDRFQEFFKNSFKEPDKLHSLWNSTKKTLTKLETYDWQEDPNFCFSHVMEKWY